MKIKLILSAILCMFFLFSCKNGENKNVYMENIESETETETEIETETAVESDESKVEDEVLYKAICQELGYDMDYELTAEDYEKVAYLAIWEGNVASLKGISLLKNLREIHIGSGSIRDIEELSLIESLAVIDISGNYITEIPDFSKCKELNSLYLSGNMIGDISPLAKLESVVYVDLCNNFISSIEPLKDNRSIKSLSLMSNCITDYSVISDNPDIIAAFEEGSQVLYEDCLAVETQAAVIVQGILDMSEAEKCEYIYQYVIDHMEFEIVYSEPKPLGYPGIFEGKGVCGDYADFFCILAVNAGLECYVCESNTHAWNIVKIDGQYYHCDSLWDDMDQEWQYYRLSGEAMGQVYDHGFNVHRYPQ